ncbi:hypothetical protein AAFF_G00150740 [Aldrovandia affinis]|uniref:Peptidase S1 domain-containing protein n=1 Tax=Aldrovandia affinis TaxID=143900 RepID=A0AAD7RNY2_9TELE|nr:hypothetical protein AAFF_G00150740 [Aldrovandia affinis]
MRSACLLEDRVLLGSGPGQRETLIVGSRVDVTEQECADAAHAWNTGPLTDILPQIPLGLEPQARAKKTPQLASRVHGHATAPQRSSDMPMSRSPTCCSSPVKGDSGGPLVCGGVARGVVSYVNYREREVLFVYTKISHHLSWIDDQMNK